MKKIVLFLSGLVACAVLAVSVQAWHNAPPEILAEPLQKESAETRMRERAQQAEQSSQEITDQMQAEKQAAEAERRAQQALSRFND